MLDLSNLHTELQKKNSCDVHFNTSNDNATVDELLHRSETSDLLVASISKRVVKKKSTK